MKKGDPPIYLQQVGPPDRLGVDPLNLTERKTGTVIFRLSKTREVQSHSRRIQTSSRVRNAKKNGGLTHLVEPPPV